MTNRGLAPLILAVVLVACGGNPAATGDDSASQVAPAISVGGGDDGPGEASASATGEGSDFCSLLTEEAVESATGYSVLNT